MDDAFTGPMLEPSAFVRSNILGRQCQQKKRTTSLRIKSNHDAALPYSAAAVANTVTMLRLPHQRIASGFLHDLHSCGEMKRILQCPNKCDVEQLSANGSLVLAYADCVRGIATKQLGGVDILKNNGEPTDAMVLMQALRVVRRAAFIGITDHFNASICLFHAMYGLVPLPVEFEADRVSKHQHAKANIVRMLKNVAYHDSYDETLYKVALEVFYANIRRYLPSMWPLPAS